MESDGTHLQIKGNLPLVLQIKAEILNVQVTIPVNTRAIIDLRFSKNGGVHEVGSGIFEFSTNLV